MWIWQVVRCSLRPRCLLSFKRSLLDSTAHLDQEVCNFFMSHTTSIISVIMVMAQVAVLYKCGGKADSVFHYVFVVHGGLPARWVIDLDHHYPTPPAGRLPFPGGP